MTKISFNYRLKDCLGLVEYTMERSTAWLIKFSCLYISKDGWYWPASSHAVLLSDDLTGFLYEKFTEEITSYRLSFRPSWLSSILPGSLNTSLTAIIRLLSDRCNWHTRRPRAVDRDPQMYFIIMWLTEQVSYYSPIGWERFIILLSN